MLKPRGFALGNGEDYQPVVPFRDRTDACKLVPKCKALARVLGPTLLSIARAKFDLRHLDFAVADAVGANIIFRSKWLCRCMDEGTVQISLI